jgi:hypothetical protein
MKRARIFRGVSPGASFWFGNLAGSARRPADMIFLNAWNEWAKQPTSSPERHGYRYLEAVRMRSRRGERKRADTVGGQNGSGKHLKK